jgi:hypothetical protein
MQTGLCEEAGEVAGVPLCALAGELGPPGVADTEAPGLADWPGVRPPLADAPMVGCTVLVGAAPDSVARGLFPRVAAPDTPWLAAAMPDLPPTAPPPPPPTPAAGPDPRPGGAPWVVPPVADDCTMARPGARAGRSAPEKSSPATPAAASRAAPAA